MICGVTDRKIDAVVGQEVSLYHVRYMSVEEKIIVVLFRIALFASKISGMKSGMSGTKLLTQLSHSLTEIGLKVQEEVEAVLQDLFASRTLTEEK